MMALVYLVDNFLGIDGSKLFINTMNHNVKKTTQYWVLFRRDLDLEIFSSYQLICLSS